MCGFLIHKREHSKVNSLNAMKDMEYRGLRTQYRGYKAWKEYDMLHTALPMIDPDPDIAIQPIQYDDEPPSLFVGEIFNHKDFGDYPTDAHMLHSKYYFHSRPSLKAENVYIYICISLYILFPKGKVAR